MKTCLTVSQILQVADLISNLPNTENGSSTDLAEHLEVDHIDYIKSGDDMKFMVYQKSNPDNIMEPEYMEFTPLALLKRIGNWKAAVAYAMTQTYYEYADHVNPFKWVRCETLSALLGFDSGYTPGASYENFTESEYGVFFGSRNNVKVVTMDKEVEYSNIAQFLEWVM